MLMPYRCVNCQDISYSFGMTCPRCGKNGTMRRTGEETYETVVAPKRHVRCPMCSSKKYDAERKRCPVCKYEKEQD